MRDNVARRLVGLSENQVTIWQQTPIRLPKRPHPVREVGRWGAVVRLRIMAGEGFALRKEKPQLGAELGPSLVVVLGGGQAQTQPNTVSIISNLYPGLGA